MAKNGSPKRLDIEEAGEMLAKQKKLASKTKKSYQTVLRRKRLAAAEMGNIPNLPPRKRTGQRYEKSIWLEQQILASGPIFPGKLQHCTFEIEDFKIQGISTVVGTGTFEDSGTVSNENILLNLKPTVTSSANDYGL